MWISRTAPAAPDLACYDAWEVAGDGGLGHPVRAELVGTEPVEGVVPSDHYGLRADLRY